MGELGAGSGSSYPTSLDTDTTKEANDGEASPTLARAAVPNDLADAIIKVETALGISPQGSFTDVVTRLDGYVHNFFPFLSIHNLVIKNNATNPNYQLDIDADLILVDWYKKTTLDLTVDITASGVNGLDTGAEANSTWYYIWVICNPPSTFGAVLSTSATAPTLPAGYTKKRLVGAIYNESTGHFKSIQQIDNRVTCPVATMLADGTNTSWSELSIAAFIPPNARAVTGYMQATTAGGYVASTTNGHGEFFVTTSTTNTFKVPILTSQKMYFKVTATGHLALYQAGWEY